MDDEIREVKTPLVYLVDRCDFSVTGVDAVGVEADEAAIESGGEGIELPILNCLPYGMLSRGKGVGGLT